MNGENFDIINIASNVKTLKKLCMLSLFWKYEYFCPPLQNETVFLLYILSFFFFVCVLIVYTYTSDLVFYSIVLSFNVTHVVWENKWTLNLEYFYVILVD